MSQSNSSCQTRQQMSLSTEPSCQPESLFFFKEVFPNQNKLKILREMLLKKSRLISHIPRSVCLSVCVLSFLSLLFFSFFFWIHAEWHLVQINVYLLLLYSTDYKLNQIFICVLYTQGESEPLHTMPQLQTQLCVLQFTSQLYSSSDGSEQKRAVAISLGPHKPNMLNGKLEKVI